MTSACGDEICTGCAADAPPPKPNGTGDPTLARLLQIAGPDDARPSADILSELCSLAADRAAREIVQDAEQRTGVLWDELRALRDAVAAGEPKARELLDHIRQIREADEPLPSAAEHAGQLRYDPPDVHIPTGLQTLDSATEGGLLSGRLHVIAGEPNLGKTSLATQLAHVACEDGFVVGFHVADVDDRRGILQRIAQRHGVDRRAFLDRDPEAIAITETIVRRWPHFRVIDEAADGRTVDESAAAILALGQKHRLRAILFVDSIQKVRLRWDAKNEPRNDKDRIDRVLRCLSSYARKGLTIIATCEVPRGYYGGPKKRRRFEGPSALAAFKASGDIEYALWTGLVLTRIKDDPDAVRVEIPKNKQGREDVTFRLTRSDSRVGYDDRGEMHDDKPEGDTRPRPEGQAEHDARMERAAHAMIPAIIEKLATAGERGLSLRDFRERLVGKNVAIDRAAELAVSEGVATSRLVRGFVRFFPATGGAAPVPQASFAPEPDYPIPEDA